MPEGEGRKVKIRTGLMGIRYLDLLHVGAEQCACVGHGIEIGCRNMNIHW